MTGNTTANNSIELHRYHSPKTVIGRFVARRTVRGAVLWGLVFGVYVASKAIGFVDLYPTAVARQKIAETFSNNIGIELLLGKAPQSASTAAYVAWNTSILMVVMGSIWALLLATKYFRGEEESGRSEVLLAGQTTPLRAVLNVLSGLWASLTVLFIVITLLFIGVGKSHGVDYGTHAAIYFAFVVTLGISLFLMIGTLASQLMPTRSRAASVAGFILGLFFLMRAIGDVTSARWLSTFTPLGWVEKSQPLSRPDPVWLIPFGVLLVLLFSLTLYFAAKRDYGESIVSDKADTKSRYGLLRSPFGFGVRLTRAANIGWLIAIFISSLIYGLITKSTAQIFSQSKNFESVLNRLAQSAKLSSTLAFLGVVYFIQMILIMSFTANSIGVIRREEAFGYLDNFLVQPFSRLRWLLGRLSITFSVVILAGIITTLGVWLGIFSQHSGVTLHTLSLAGVNALVPAIFLIGVAIFVYGIYPRLTSMFAYAVLVWSLLIDLVGSGLKLNHWLLDTSLLHQVVLAPSVRPNWSIDIIILGLAVIFMLIGALRFNVRDIEGE